MGTLADNLADDLANAAAPELPTARVTVGKSEGEFEGYTTTEPVTDFGPVFKLFNLDPDVWAVDDDTVRMSMWQQSRRAADGSRDVVNLYSYKARFVRRIVDGPNLPALYAAARKPAKRVKATREGVTTHVLFGDPQIGKQGSRGGTPELLKRLAEKRVALDAWMKTNPAEKSYMWDAGDGVEGIENTGQQIATNDISLVDQVDVYATELYEFLRVMHKHGDVEDIIIPSNHAQLRRGKDLIGKPTDDWGIFAHKQVKKITDAAGMGITFHLPDIWAEGLALSVGPVRIGIVHGHQGRSLDRMPDFWDGHAAGAGPLHAVDIGLSGHWHTPRLTFGNRSPRTGKSKVYIGAPTLDNGSDWFANLKGEESDPGMIVFQTDQHGFNLQSFTIL